MNACAGCCDAVCTARVMPHKIGKEELATTIDERKRVSRGAHRCNRADDITIGGEGSAVEFFIRMISKKYEIKKQVIGEDPDLEKSGRILNRVIEWDRDGITIESDQRHVREILKCVELERANHSATPCTVERRHESQGENRCGRGRTKTKHRWDDVNHDDDKDRP